MSEADHTQSAGTGPDEGDLSGAFGPYRIVRRVGAGGMSVVFEAVHVQRGRREALKVLRKDLGADPQVAARFHREVQAMAGLRHDHILTVYDSGDVDERLYYTMPLLPGGSLGDVLVEIRETGETVPGRRANEVLDRHGIAPSAAPDESPALRYARRVAGMLASVADALDTMHEQDVLHRDVKPSNLMLDDRGRVLVSDFGIVHVQDQRLTRTGQAMGTPAYMSPEQISSGRRPVDGRSDVYSLGAALYEMLTLRLPHEGETLPEVLERILHHRARPIRASNPEVPAAIETIVARCLEPRVRDRYANARLLRDDLAAFARGGEVRARPMSRVQRLGLALGRNWRPLAAAALVAVGALVFFLTRPAYLSIRTVPTATVALDGEELGTSPLRGHVLPPGDHVVRVERGDLFHPLEHTLSFASGHTQNLAWVLLPRDPAHPEVVKIFAEARGYGPTPVVVASLRSSPKAGVLLPLWPRGRVREAPRELVLLAEGFADEFRVELEGAKSDGGVLQAWSASGFDEDVRLPLEAEVRAALRPGTPYRVPAPTPAGDTASDAEFSILDADTLRRADAAVAEAIAPFDADDPSRLFVQAEALLAHQLYAEAFAVAAQLLETLGPRKEVARVALAVLDAAGLRDVGPWAEWALMYRRAER